MSKDEVAIVTQRVNFVLQPGWEPHVRVHRSPMRDDLITAIEVVARPPRDQLERLTRWLHGHRLHPDYEYRTTNGPRKAWEDEDVPPPGDGWERNEDEGNGGWERFDYHEESYWRRLKPAGEAAP